MWAAMDNAEDVARWLLEKGADINIRQPHVGTQICLVSNCEQRAPDEFFVVRAYHVRRTTTQLWSMLSAFETPTSSSSSLNTRSPEVRFERTIHLMNHTECTGIIFFLCLR